MINNRNLLKEVSVEVEEWLKVYQAVTLTAKGKESSYWMIVVGFLFTNCFLMAPLAVLFISYAPWKARLAGTTLGIIGLFACICWFVSQRWAAKEISHWRNLLCSLEGQFAGGEFHRITGKLLNGEEVCISGAAWKHDDWYPEVERLSWFDRISPEPLIGLLPVVFLGGWLAVAIASWVV